MRSIYIIAVLSLFGCQPAKQVEIVKVIDGDTLLVSFPDGKSEQLDLAFIDAPEREQPFGREALQKLNEYVEQKPEFVITDFGIDLKLAKQSVNEALVMQGFAWSKPRINDPQVMLAYSLLQTEAAETGKGIWALEHALRVPPWVWKAQATQRLPNKQRPFERNRRQGKRDVD